MKTASITTEVEVEAPPPEKRKPGRPKGSRTRPALHRPDPTPTTSRPHSDYRYADPDALVARQLSLIDWAQKALRTEMQRGMQSTGVRIDHVDILRIEKLSASLVKCVQALKHVSDLSEELKGRLSPKELLEAAAAKLEGQDLPTLRYYITRLNAFAKTLAQKRVTPDATGFGKSAAAAIASLED